MEERACEILNALVREFIQTGEPVSSGWLFDHYDFGIRPAMIRSEMNELEERGFLEQPHHSAGRIPRDRALEFFVSSALRETQNSPDLELLSLLHERAWNEVVGKLSDELGVLGALSSFQDVEVYKEGLENLIDNLDWNSREEIRSVIHDFEEFDVRVDQLKNQIANKEDDQLKVYIGRKSPVTRSNQLSVIMKNCSIDGEEVLLFAIGPKRMNYEKAVKLLKNIQEN
ncbi:MAG: hypothetical protein V1489_00790 [Candidatus Liptonbacteria bacterium]